MLRKELQTLTQNVAERIQTDTIEIGPRGVTIKSPLPPQLQERKIRFRRYITAVYDQAVLNIISKRLNVPAANGIAAARKLLVAEMNRRVNTDQDMDRLSATLKRITRQDF
jgi:hypothetical protein